MFFNINEDIECFALLEKDTNFNFKLLLMIALPLIRD